jgi:predicted GNAT superfamily acetyltransferase
MTIRLRDITEADLDGVLALNNSAGRSIIPIDAIRLRSLYDEAAYFRVAEIDGGLAGFLIALRPDADYASPNFAWFKANVPDFVYIDRIVVGRPYRGHGLGRVFYADVQSFAEVRSPVLACEVFLEPRDDASVLFHGTFGFREAGQQTLPNGRRVSLLTKSLCSWEWVRDTYWTGASPGLPALSWLGERARSGQNLSRAAG